MSTLVQVMAWCPQAAKHYLNQCRQSSVTPFGAIWPQCVNGTVYAITMMPHEYCCISNCWQLNSLCNILFRLTVKKITKPHITGPVIQWITLTDRASNMEYTSMLWCHSGRQCIFELSTLSSTDLFPWQYIWLVPIACSIYFPITTVSLCQWQIMTTNDSWFNSADL